MKHLKGVLVLGYGTIGQALSPFLRARFPHCRIHVIDETLDATRSEISGHYGFTAEACRVDALNYREVLKPHLAPGALLLNLATSVSSRDVLTLCQDERAFYLDTRIDDWRDDAPASPTLPASHYALREAILAIKARSLGRSSAVVAHGASPGFVSVLVKKALLLMASQFSPAAAATPITRLGWARLAQRLDVRVIQISQRDSQASARPRDAREFVNTWSIPGFIDEILRPAEAGWGSHERHLPEAAREHAHGSRSSITLAAGAGALRVKSWAPMARDFTGLLLNSGAAVSLADYFSIGGGTALSYRPTTLCAYQPCTDAQRSASLIVDGAREGVGSMRVIREDITHGADELGVILVSGTHPTLWFGSMLPIDKAREWLPHNNATSLHTASSVMAAIEWIVEHPDAGILEPEDIDHDFIFSRTCRYWEPLVHEFRTWTPSSLERPFDCQFADFVFDEAAAQRVRAGFRSGDLPGGASEFGPMAFA